MFLLKQSVARFLLRWHLRPWRPVSRVLLVTPQYPSPSDLYRYAFVHTRVLQYLKAGVLVDVVRVGPRVATGVRTFDGVTIAEVNFRLLRTILDAHYHTHVATHTLIPGFWKAFGKHRERVHLLAWIHGAEGQPWFRRHWLHTDIASRTRARTTTTERLNLWRRVLEGAAAGSKVVFVSRHQAQQVINDTGVLSCAAELHVIPNPIDTQLFAYHRKPVEQRFRVLSVRPYNNSTYANDLTVRAILNLAEHQNFTHFRFTIVGDGPLFDSTLLPLRRFANVDIRKGFLPQLSLPNLHREHGVFMCPSRMDTHGVSRDEAMASGLVPITTKTAAIPEFVDDSSGILVEPEDPNALADALLSLANDPELFTRLSEGAAARIRSTTAAEAVTARELSLLRGTDGKSPSVFVPDKANFRVALYADINPNAVDGSAIWLATIAEVLGRIPEVSASLFLKTPLQRTILVDPLLSLCGTVRLVEPNIPESAKLDISSAISMLSEKDACYNYDAIILRGRALCLQAATMPWADKMWAYLTDIPQSKEKWTKADIDDVRAITCSCRWLLCQTQALADHLREVLPDAGPKLRLFPPAIPTNTYGHKPPTKEASFRFVYAGKFANTWGIEEMFDALCSVRKLVPRAECHVFGDKFHTSEANPDFVAKIRGSLSNLPGVVWHGGASRNTVMHALQGMHAAWAYRHASLESSTLELSTKLLEYASAGVPPICASNKINKALLGSDYPYFADTGLEASEKLLLLATTTTIDPSTSAGLKRAADMHSLAAVRQLILDQGLIPRKS